jgi:hypothetical protein
VIPVTRTSEPDFLKQNANRWLKELQTAIINLEQVKSNSISKPQDIKTAKTKVKNAQPCSPFSDFRSNRQD